VRHDPRSATYITVIQNPDSGTGGPGRDRLVRLLGDDGFSVTYAATTDKGWEHVLDDPGDIVLVAGGDGTVGHVAERLVGRGVPLAILARASQRQVVNVAQRGGMCAVMLAG
jgi:diacylglycerol kinase family enzyme